MAPIKSASLKAGTAKRASLPGASSLVLGWAVNAAWAPKYWLRPGAAAGQQSLESLITVPASNAAAHTVIVAQSGSGKSFFLGRLIEELLLRTKCRCVVLDPNADFRRAYESQPDSLWRDAKYVEGSTENKLPHEASRAVFADRWSDVRIAIRSVGANTTEYQQKLEVWWPSISSTFLAEDLDFRVRTEVYHYHEFTSSLVDILQIRSSEIDLFGQAQLVSNAARSLSDDDLRTLLQSQYSPKTIFNSGKKDPSLQLVDVERKVERLKQKALAIPKHVSVDIQRFYLDKAREYETAGILGGRPPAGDREPNDHRLSVIDLPSVTDPATRLLAVHAGIAALWQRARMEWEDALRGEPEQDVRVPTFVVIDEAHNIIPFEPRGGAQLILREQFRTLAAEGRKYGIFLILASQRPDRLDPVIVSECENRAIMRLNSDAVIADTIRLLGLNDGASQVIRTLIPGRVLLFGRWGSLPGTRLYCAARRTVEGGRNLRADHWASPTGHA